MIKPDDIVREVLLRYSRFGRFSCHASLNRIIQTGTATSSDILMKLLYVRPRQFFIEWWHKSRFDDRRLIMSVGDCALRHSPLEPKWELEKSIEHAIAGDAGISSGLVLYVPSLLIGYNGFALFERAERCDKVIVGAHEVYQISGLGSSSITRFVTVCPEDFTIKRISESYPIANGVVRCESEFSDIEIDET